MKKNFHESAGEHHARLAEAHERCAKVYASLSVDDGDEDDELSAAHAEIAEAHRGLADLHSDAEAGERKVLQRTVVPLPDGVSVVAKDAPRIVARDGVMAKLLGENDTDPIKAVPPELRRLVATE